MALFALTIFVSAFLLFLVQPIIAKQILPWFGGTAAVWSTCLVFFQAALLAGYFYSDWLVRKLGTFKQAAIHIALIVLALALLPIVPDRAWQPEAGAGQPSWQILLLLAATIGLPYFLLSTTSPLVQAWFARAYPTRNPYKLFALSNLASMLALVGYPFLIEPTVTTHEQAIAWSWGFGLFAVLIAVLAWRSIRHTPATRTEPAPALAPTRIGRPPTRTQKWIWIALAAIGSSMLLGVSNHLTQNISSIPLLWVLPLALYLLTFIVCFSSEGATRWYPRVIALPQTALIVCAMAWLLADKRLDFMLYLHIVVFGAGLFITCMYCHGELAARKPAAEFLTTFYLMISIGGAVGAFLIGIVAPLTLPAYYELGFVLYALAMLATWLLWREAHWLYSIAGLTVCAFTLAASLYAMGEFSKGAIVMTRNFYGTLRVREYGTAEEVDGKRSLIHGAILHGDQYLDPTRRRIATTYYTVDSGIGLALLDKDAELTRPLRVGLIGLGAGTLAAYGKAGDVFRFYEINPDVVKIAREQFSYLRDSGATIEIALGDARLNMEREAPQRFDVLAIDAFSSDSIPVHLITREALAAYEKHMQPNGIIAFHVSNRFLDLQPVVARLAWERQLAVAWIEAESTEDATATDWVLLSKSAAELAKPVYADRTSEIPERPDWRTWTDDFNNIVQVLK